METVEHDDHIESRDGPVDLDLSLQRDVGIDNPTTSFTPQVLLALFALSFNYMASAFGSTGPASLLSFINADVGPSPNFAWIAISWTLGNAVVQTIGGRLTDIFGRRYFMISGAALSFVGSIVGATGKIVNQLIGAGVILGIAAGSQQLAFPCVQEIVPKRWRSTVLGLFALAYAPAQFAPIIGYALVKNTTLGWRWMYWIVTISDFIALIGLFLFYKPPSFKTKHGSKISLGAQVKLLDYVGLFLFTCAMVLFLLGLSWGGSSYPWKSAEVLCVIILGGVLFIALWLWEAYSKTKFPLLPPRLFRRKKEFVAPLALLFFSGMLYYSLLVLWPLETNVLFNITDLITEGWFANALEIRTVIACILLALLAKPLKHYNWQLIGTMIGQVAFIGSLASLNPTKRGYGFAGVVIGGIFITYLNLLVPVVLGLGVEEADIGIAIGLGGTVRGTGGSVATAIYTTILANRLASQIPAQLANVATQYRLSPAMLLQLEKASALNTAAAYAAIPGITPAVILAAQKGVQHAYALAFQTVYYVSIAFGGLAIIVACFCADVQSKLTNRVAVVLENAKENVSEVSSHGEKDRAEQTVKV